MKNTPERIYLDIEDYHEFNYNIEYVNQHKQTDEDIEYIRKDISEAKEKDAYESGCKSSMELSCEFLFTKEECEAKEKESYKKGSDDCHKAFVSSGHFTKEQVAGIVLKALEAETFSIKSIHAIEIEIEDIMQWLEQEKPFDSK